jgi:NO-binding membrane sensor protein with MHYT domain/two-component sensor histidine kinase
MGCGIWSMHFIGMLALRSPVLMSYDIPITALSLLIAVAASWFALYFASRQILEPIGLLLGSCLMGLAIDAMHYTGMAAARMSPPIHYDLGLVALSCAIAIATSIAALWSAFKLRLETVFTAFWKKAGSATVMGTGICLMHYTGMAAARFPLGSVSTVTPQNFSHVWLAALLGAFTLVFLLSTLLLSALDAYFSERTAERARILQALNGELEKSTQELSRANILLQQEVQARRQAEEALREARDELEARVIERTGQLRQLYEEREHMARDMHDNIVQSIYVAGLNLEQIEQLIQRNPVQAARDAAKTVEVLNGVIRDIRRYIDSPAELTGALPLQDRLAQLTELSRPNSQPRFRLKVDAAADNLLSPDEAEHVLQIAREAMSNSRRHSHAKRGTVALVRTDDGVTFEVGDDGDGFDPATLAHEGHGLYNMKSRAQQMGARLEILSSPGKGTRVVLHIPKVRRPP